jgi:hypothetical protein
MAGAKSQDTDDEPQEQPRYSVFDLTLDQIAHIEDESGIPFGLWHATDQPRGKLDALLMSAFLKRSLKKTGLMTMREMLETRPPGDSDPDR